MFSLYIMMVVFFSWYLFSRRHLCKSSFYVVDFVGLLLRVEALLIEDDLLILTGGRLLF
jgi:hypothetical protein